MFSTERFRDWILLLLCNLIWASQFVLVKIVQEQMGPVAATSFPMLIATVLLIPIVRWESRSQQARHPSIPGADLLRFLLIGVLGQVVAQLFITWGLRFSLASNAALLMLALPIATTVMAYFLLGETMSRIRWISFALAIAGVVECSGVDWKALDFTGKGYLLGNVLIFISVCGSAFYNVYSKKLLERYTPLQVLLYSYYFVIAFLIPIYALCRAWRFSPNRFLHCEDLARDCSARGVSVLSLDGNFSFGVNPSRCDPGQLVQLHDPVLWPRHCCPGAA